MTNKTPSSNSPTEHETRKQYIDAMLRDAGWRLGADWLEEVELQRTMSFTGTTASPWR